LIGNSKACTFICENSGGDGCFKILLPSDKDVEDKEYEVSACMYLVISPITRDMTGYIL